MTAALSEPTPSLPEVIARSLPFEVSADEVQIESLGGGITNRNLTVRCPTRDPRTFVVRLPGERTEVLGINRTHEAQATEIAAALGIAPPIVGQLVGVGTLITEFVPGRHLEGAEFVRHLPTVVGLIKQFHDAGAIDGQFPVHRVVEAHAQDAVKHRATLTAQYAELHAISAKIEAAFAINPDPPVACHNDLLPGNILFDQQRCWLLDFEYAGMNDRYFDLANLSVNAGLSAADQRTVLDCYFGTVSARSIARLRLMMIMSEFREAMWAVVQQAISTLDTDFVAYASERFDSARSIIASSPLDQLLSEAAQPTR